MTKKFEIYFSDFTEEAQKELMEFVGISTPEEANWDTDIFPIAVLEVEVEDNE